MGDRSDRAALCREHGQLELEQKSGLSSRPENTDQIRPIGDVVSSYLDLACVPKVANPYFICSFPKQESGFEGSSS